MRPCRIAALLALAVACGCGKKGPPSGGPPDLVPPTVILSVPDSGAARVSPTAVLSLTFSEGMEPRSTNDAIALAPPMEIKRFRWSGRTVSLELAESLKTSYAYTLMVGVGARDRHGNPLREGVAVVFTAADSFPPGSIEGKIEARGFSAGAAYLWCYDAARNHPPDSTGRDFDALGIVDADGQFRIPGLEVPASYKLWAFADLNGNRSFEPATEILAPIDTLISLTSDTPRATGLAFRVVNPRAPVRVRGTVIDSLREREGTAIVMAVADSDTTRRVTTGVIPAGSFEIQLDPGDWTLRAFKDLDRNRLWNPAREPASLPQRFHLEPAEVLENVRFELLPTSQPP